MNKENKNKNKIFIIENNNEENKEYINNSIIPSYQRGYKWEDKNVKDLLNDIDSINNEDKKDHYI